MKKIILLLVGVAGVMIVSDANAMFRFTKIAKQQKQQQRLCSDSSGKIRTALDARNKAMLEFDNFETDLAAFKDSFYHEDIAKRLKVSGSKEHTFYRDELYRAFSDLLDKKSALGMIRHNIEHAFTMKDLEVKHDLMMKDFEIKRLQQKLDVLEKKNQSKLSQQE